MHDNQCMIVALFMFLQGKRNKANGMPYSQRGLSSQSHSVRSIRPIRILVIAALCSCFCRPTSGGMLSDEKDREISLPMGDTVVVVLVDDVDDMLTPLEKVMPSVHSLKQQGVTFTNSFVTTPVCCPSRSSIFSGRYQHNNRCFRNSIKGGCSSPW